MSAQNSHMVALRDVTMEFEDKKVLDDLSLTVEPQERLVVMGQSGSGKSTILRLILGILKPNDGEVFFKQFEVTRLKRRKLQQVRRADRDGLSVLGACSAHGPCATTWRLPLEELTDKSRKEIDKIVDEKLELVGMKDAKDHDAVGIEWWHAQTG